MIEKQSPHERLKLFIDEKYFGIISHFAKVIEIAPALINTYRVREETLPRKHRDKVEQAGMSWHWYETGEGAMYSASASTKSNVESIQDARHLVMDNVSKYTVQEIIEIYKALKPVAEAFENMGN